MFKNVAAKIALFAFDVSTGLPKTGDAANLTAYVSKDHGAVTALADTTATELDATNAKGWYLFDVAQAETNADLCLFSGKSVTANVVVVARPVYTMPPNFSKMVVDAAGLVDSNVVKVGPTGAGVAQTASDLGGKSLRVGVALPDFIFLMTDSTTHNPSPGKTVTVTRSINGGAFAATTAGTATELSDGHYFIDLSAADMGGKNVTLLCSAFGCDALTISLVLDLP